jgi:hypothetical protein
MENGQWKMENVECEFKNYIGFVKSTLANLKSTLVL